MPATTTAVAEWLGLWCMEQRVAGSNFVPVFDLLFFFFSSLEKFLSLMAG